MDRWDQNDNFESDGGADIYNTPDTSRETQEYGETEEIPAQSVTVEEIPAAETDVSAPAPYNGEPDNPYAGQYGGQYQSPHGGGNSYSGGTPYDSGNVYGGGNPYDSGNPYGGGNPYDSGKPYGGGTPYHNGNGQSYGNSNPYNNGNPYGGQPNGNGTPYNNGNSYGNGQPYGSGSPYNNGSSQTYGGGTPYNNNTNPYSPYAVPPKKNKNGLIIALVVTVIVLLLIAVFALTYKLTRSVLRDRDRYDDRDEYNFDDDWDIHHDYDYDYDDFDDDGDTYGSGDSFADDSYGDDGGSYDDDGYYELHDELRWDLSYVVDFEEYYEGDSENEDAQGESGRDIYITYPVIAGDNVPNLDSLNRTIMDEVDFLKGVADDAEEGVDVYLSAESYVTYMDEEKLSIVFQEDLYLDYGDSGQSVDYYLYSLNIDMENGVVLDNRSMVHTDDDFSVDFRQRSDEQNGEIDYLTSLSDQEITDYFKSDDIIVFYTPLGMEIGFNYEYGWVTVTYRDYEQYLQVF